MDLSKHFTNTSMYKPRKYQLGKAVEISSKMSNKFLTKDDIQYTINYID